MAKGNGSTRRSTSSASRGLTQQETQEGGRFRINSGGAQLATRDFPSNLKFSELIDGGQFVNGGEYYMMNRDDDMLVFSLENGYNENYGSTGTLITVSVRRFGASSDDVLTRDFVEGEAFRESGGREVYNNEEAIARRINRSMPYYTELANNRLRRQ